MLIKDVLKSLFNIRNALLLILLATTLFLRFKDLSHSDYISDEPGTFFYRGGKKNPEMSKIEFILSQRKGPLQLFVGYIPYAITQDYDNELAQRLPFTIFGSAAIIVFFLLIEKLTGNKYIAFISSMLLSVNGLMVGYARIAQYQNLNLFFSFLSLYFYVDFIREDKNILRSSVIGTALFGISFLAHWDAIYILIPAAILFMKYLKRGDISLENKKKLILFNVIAGSVVILPYALPYFFTIVGIEDNLEYASNIFGFGDSFLNRSDRMQFEVYNPFLALYVYGVGGLVGIFFTEKNPHYPIFTAWFITTLLIFRFFISYSGLHFYNVFIPLVVMVGFSVWEFSKIKFAKIPTTLATILVLAFLTNQSYLLFVEHKTEYPWENERIPYSIGVISGDNKDEKNEESENKGDSENENEIKDNSILGIFEVKYLETKSYDHSSNLRHLTGFPHKRYWNQINEYINKENEKRQTPITYITNEDKELAKYYMDAQRSEGEKYYAIGIKKPHSFANDYKFSQIKGKSTVHKIENEYGETVVRIYLVGEE